MTQKDINDYINNTYYYIRTSTKEQQLTRQLPEGVDPKYIYEDHGFSGRTINRDAYLKLVAHVTPGDTIVFTDISRHGRSLIELINEAKTLTERGICLKYEAENITLDPFKPKSDPDWVRFHLMGVLAEAAIEIQKQSSLDGIKRQQELDKFRPHDQKKYKGKQPTIDRTIVAELWVEKGYNKSEIARIMSISVKSVRAIIKELGIENKQEAPAPSPDMM